MSPETTKELIEWLNVESILAKEDNSPIAASRLRDSAQRLRELEKDAARYQWLRRASVEWSFDNALIASLVRDQKELDASIPEKVDAAIQSKAGL